MPDSIVQSVINQFAARAEAGKAKYGTTMDRDDLTSLEWLQHLQEELMDAVVYLQKLKTMSTEFPDQRFEVSLMHYGKRITIELDHCDVSAEELVETFYQLAMAAEFPSKAICEAMHFVADERGASE